MGRSVETIRDAEVIYFCIEYDEYDEFWNEFWYDDFILNIKSALHKRYKSMDYDPKYHKPYQWQYPYREQFTITGNYHCVISISEYCGRVAISIATNPQSDYPELSEHWLNQNTQAIKDTIKPYLPGAEIVKQGTFSNGVSVYKRAD